MTEELEEFAISGNALMVRGLEHGVKPIKIPAGFDPTVFRTVVSACYNAYIAEGRIPDLDECQAFWPRVSKKTFAEIMVTPEFTKAMKHRGIDWDDVSGLSYQQSLTIDLLSNPLDHRPDAARIADLGVSPVMLAAWRQNPLFMRILSKRSESNIQTAVPMAVNRLVGKADSGHFDSIKLVLAMSGRYDPNNQEVANLREFLQEMVRIIQIRVMDPDVRAQIAADLASAGVVYERMSQAALNPGS